MERLQLVQDIQAVKSAKVNKESRCAGFRLKNGGSVEHTSFIAHRRTPTSSCCRRRAGRIGHGSGHSLDLAAGVARHSHRLGSENAALKVVVKQQAVQVGQDNE